VSLHEDSVSREARSAVSPNSNHPNWNYSFYASLDTLSAAGLDLAVLDFDGDPTPAERVGGINVPHSLLAQVANSGQIVNIDTHSDDLESLHVRLQPVPIDGAASSTHYELPLADGMITTPLHVPKGSRITVHVEGTGKIGTGGPFACTNTPDITPSGLLTDQCRSHNLKTLQTAPHGSAFAHVGFGTSFQTVSLVEEEGAGCMQFDAGESGILAFGVNDNDVQNNAGTFRFDVRVQPPTSDTRGCPTAVGPTAAHGSTRIQQL
jgi:hypothetical protein